MELDQEIKKTTLVLRPAGDLELSNSVWFRNSVLDRLSEGRCEKLVLNFSKLSYIDSSGLGALMKIYSEMKGRGGLRICHVQDQVRDAIALGGYNRFLTIDGSEKESLAGFGE